MITANISTYAGQCSDAEHYYCSYFEVPDDIPSKHYRGPSYEKNELKRALDHTSARELSKKDHFHWPVGTMVNRFDSIDQIHEELKKQFPGQTIVTYEDYHIFKEMLYFKDGVNLGVEFFGECWETVPRSVYKDLIPESFVIKCESCGHQYPLEEVSIEMPYGKRTIVNFNKKRDMDDPCCDQFDLIWNVIL